MNNTQAIHPASHDLDIHQNGDENGCQVVGGFITIHQGANLLSLGCSAAVQGEGIGIAQDGDRNDTCVMGLEHEVIQNGHQNQAFVLGGQGNRVEQNGFGSRVHILNGDFKYNRVKQLGMSNEADVQGHANRLLQDGGPAALVRGNRNIVRQLGLDNVACVGKDKRKAHRNTVVMKGNQNLLRVAGNENELKSSGYRNCGTVRGDLNSLSVRGEDNRVVTRGTGNQVMVRGSDNVVKVIGEGLNLFIKGDGIRGVFEGGVFVPAPECEGVVEVTVVEAAGSAPLVVVRQEV